MRVKTGIEADHAVGVAGELRGEGIDGPRGVKVEIARPLQSAQGDKALFVIGDQADRLRLVRVGEIRRIRARDSSGALDFRVLNDAARLVDQCRSRKAQRHDIAFEISAELRLVFLKQRLAAAAGEQ